MMLIKTIMMEKIDDVNLRAFKTTMMERIDDVN